MQCKNRIVDAKFLQFTNKGHILVFVPRGGDLLRGLLRDCTTSPINRFEALADRQWGSTPSFNLTIFRGQVSSIILCQQQSLKRKYISFSSIYYFLGVYKHVNAGCIIQVANTLITVCGAKVGRGEGRISNACQQQRRLSQILNIFIPTSRYHGPLNHLKQLSVL